MKGKLTFIFKRIKIKNNMRKSKKDRRKQRLKKRLPKNIFKTKR